MLNEGLYLYIETILSMELKRAPNILMKRRRELNSFIKKMMSFYEKRCSSSMGELINDMNYYSTHLAL